MSDPLREECGIALIRLKKPLSYYQDKYGTSLWGLYRLFLLMEKQHNRGQDGAGVGALKLGIAPGYPYMFRQREIRSNPIDRIFTKMLDHYTALEDAGTIKADNPELIKKHFEFAAEIYMGHLRYGTSGGYQISSCHPYFRKNNWPTRNLMLAGNFNITNTPYLNQSLIERGQHPIFDTDTQTLLEEIGYYLDQGHQELYRTFRQEGLVGAHIAGEIRKRLKVSEVLKKASKNWDGGYALVGIIGNGDAFAFRDPNGIRPLHYLDNDEVLAVASERAPLLTVFSDCSPEIKEVPRGNAIIIKQAGEVYIEEIIPARPEKHCSFERIYFSRGNDPVIYQERKALGSALREGILEAVNHELNKCVFSFIPNTAEIAYYGLINELQRTCDEAKKTEIEKARVAGTLDSETIEQIFNKYQYKTEKVALKDIKLRTFISKEKSRNKLASHVYDISYGSISPDEHLICVDDSIVRGTTLKKSIIKILSLLNPKSIVIVSTAPQIRYPDCYGIDMSQLEKFIAFQAMLQLLQEANESHLLDVVYEDCLKELAKPLEEMQNKVKTLYDKFTTDQISLKIAQLVRPHLENWSGEVKVVYQTIDNLHKALTLECGDWYFTGDYPTPGGYRVVNQAFVNFYEKKQGRSY